MYAIRSYYEGYYKTDVSYDLEQTDPRVARLNIVIKEPKKLYIKDIKIEGAKQIDPDDLKGELATTERKFYSWITGTGVLKDRITSYNVCYTKLLRMRFPSTGLGFGEDGIVIAKAREFEPLEHGGRAAR